MALAGQTAGPCTGPLQPNAVPLWPNVGQIVERCSKCDPCWFNYFAAKGPLFCCKAHFAAGFHYLVARIYYFAARLHYLAARLHCLAARLHTRLHYFAARLHYFAARLHYLASAPLFCCKVPLFGVARNSSSLRTHTGTSPQTYFPLESFSGVPGALARNRRILFLSPNAPTPISSLSCSIVREQNSLPSTLWDLNR